MTIILLWVVIYQLKLLKTEEIRKFTLKIFQQNLYLFYNILQISIVSVTKFEQTLKFSLALAHQCSLIIKDQIYYFGGLNQENKAVNHFYKMNCFSKIQEQIFPIGQLPSPRFNAGMCANLDETQIYIYGGIDDNKRCYNDFYVYDLERNEIRKINLTCTTTAMQPPCIHSHQLVPLTQNEYMLVGGMKQSGILETNDYLITFINGIYQIQQIRTNKMHAPLFGHTVTRLNDVLYLIGGLSEGKAYNQYVYSFEINRRKWEIVSIQRQAPINRYYHQATAIDQDKIIISGGQFGEKQTQIYDQIWMFTPQYRSFVRIDHKGKFQPRTAFTQIFWKSATGNLRLVITGGISVKGVIFDGIQLLLDSRLSDSTPGLIKSTVDANTLKYMQQSITFKEQPLDQQLALSSAQQQPPEIQQQIQQQNEKYEQKSILKTTQEQKQGQNLTKRLEFLEFELIKLIDETKKKSVQESEIQKINQNLNEINEKIIQLQNQPQQSQVQFPHLAFQELRQEIFSTMQNKMNDAITDAQADTEQKLRQVLQRKIDDQNVKIEVNTNNIQTLNEKQQEFYQFLNENYVKNSQFQVIRPSMQTLEQNYKNIESQQKFFKEKLMEIEGKQNLHEIQLSDCEVEGNLKEGIRKLFQDFNEQNLKRSEHLNNQIVNIQRQYNDLQEDIKSGQFVVKIQRTEEEMKEIEQKIQNEVKTGVQSLQNEIQEIQQETDRKLCNLSEGQQTQKIIELQEEVKKLNFKVNELMRNQIDYLSLNNKFEGLVKEMNVVQGENKILKSQIENYRMSEEDKDQEIEMLRTKLQKQDGQSEQKVRFETWGENMQQQEQQEEKQEEQKEQRINNEQDVEQMQNIEEQQQNEVKDQDNIEMNNQDQQEQEQKEEHIEEQKEEEIQEQEKQNKEKENEQNQEDYDQLTAFEQMKVTKDLTNSDLQMIKTIMNEDVSVEEQEQNEDKEQDKIEDNTKQEEQEERQEGQNEQEQIEEEKQQDQIEDEDDYISKSINKTLQPPRVSIVSEPQIETSQALQRSAVLEQEQAIQTSQPQSILRKSQVQTENEQNKMVESQSLHFEKPQTFSPIKFQSTVQQNNYSNPETSDIQETLEQTKMQRIEEQKQEVQVTSQSRYEQIELQPQEELFDEDESYFLEYNSKSQCILIADKQMIKVFDCQDIETNKTADPTAFEYPDQDTYFTCTILNQDQVTFALNNGLVRVQNNSHPEKQCQFSPFGYQVIKLFQLENENHTFIVCSTQEGFIGVQNIEENDFKVVNDQEIDGKLIAQEIEDNLLISVFSNGTLLICDLVKYEIISKVQIQEITDVKEAFIHQSQIYLIQQNHIEVSDLEGKIVKTQFLNNTQKIDKIYVTNQNQYLVKNNLVEIYDQNEKLVQRIFNLDKVMNICVSGKLLFIQDKLKRVVCNLM